MVDSTHKDEFDQAFRDFIDAHGRGMRSLSEGNFRGLQDAVADESAAVERVSAIISESLNVPRLASTFEAHRASQANESLRAQHARLFDQMRALEREHRGLETRPDDLDARREHRAKLVAHIAELRLHLKRLRDEADGARVSDPDERRRTP